MNSDGTGWSAKLALSLPLAGRARRPPGGRPRTPPMPQSTAHRLADEPRTPARRTVNRVRDSACRRATGGRTVRAVRAGAARGTRQGWSVVIASGPRTSRRRPSSGVAASRGPARRGPLATGLACSASLATWSSTRTAPNRRDRVRCSTICRAGPGARMAAWTPCSTVSAHRDPLVIVFNENRSIAEPAGLLGVPEGTVKSRCHYAMRALRVLLQEWSLVP
jgi:hypothetical protein